jgi:hypothetical protein
VHVNNQLVAWTDLTASGSPNRALAIGSTSDVSWSAGAWSVGRGLYGGAHTDRAYGFIDEVRICNSALMPSQFLATSRPRVSLSMLSATSLLLSVTRGEPGATCYVLQSTDLSHPFSDWTAMAAGSFDLNGRSSVPADIRAQIIYAMEGAVAEYNRYGTFNKTLTANYNPGVPTAQASYDGWIDFGGSRNYRVALHEISHTLGVGTGPGFCGFVSGGTWTGSNAVWQVRQFDGPSANLNSDCTHIWPYGLNYDNEASTENNRRHVLMVKALRHDMGIP